MRFVQLIIEPPSGHSVMHLDYQMQHALALGLSSHGQQQQGYNLADIACDLGRSCPTDRKHAVGVRALFPSISSCTTFYFPSCPVILIVRRSMVLRAVYLLAKQLRQRVATK